MGRLDRVASRLRGPHEGDVHIFARSLLGRPTVMITVWLLGLVVAVDAASRGDW